ISKLFSRKRPENLGTQSTSEELFDAYDKVEPERELFLQNLQAIKKQLEEQHKFKLTSDDEASIQYVYGSFYAGGPGLTYNGVGNGSLGRSQMPSYGELMVMTDEEGVNR